MYNVHTGNTQIRHLPPPPPLRSFALQRGAKEGRKHPKTGPTKSGTCFAPFWLILHWKPLILGSRFCGEHSKSRVAYPENHPFGTPDLAVYISLVWGNHTDRRSKPPCGTWYMVHGVFATSDLHSENTPHRMRVSKLVILDLQNGRPVTALHPV